MSAVVTKWDFKHLFDLSNLKIFYFKLLCENIYFQNVVSQININMLQLYFINKTMFINFTTIKLYLFDRWFFYVLWKEYYYILLLIEKVIVASNY